MLDLGVYFRVEYLTAVNLKSETEKKLGGESDTLKKGSNLNHQTGMDNTLRIRNKQLGGVSGPHKKVQKSQSPDRYQLEHENWKTNLMGGEQLLSRFKRDSSSDQEQQLS